MPCSGPAVAYTHPVDSPTDGLRPLSASRMNGRSGRSAQGQLRGPTRLAHELRAFAGAVISHVRLVIDPVTPAGVESLGPVLEALDAG